jgi:nitrite reductase/ring-hydroxylating ferredoxin subunit
MQIRIPETKSLKHGETRLFTFPSRYGDLQGFVIRYGENLHAYENKCLHWPIPLDFGDGDFYYAKINRIVCKNHGAEYDPETGICDAGPCGGEALIRFPVTFDGSDALVTIPELE